MKVLGIIFFIIALLIGSYAVKSVIRSIRLNYASEVVDGIVIEINDNYPDPKTRVWRKRWVAITVEYNVENSLKTTRCVCLAGSPNEYEHLSCGEVGDVKKVRYLPSEIFADANFPNWPQVTDTGDYLGSTSWGSFIFMTVCGVFAIIFYVIGMVLSEMKKAQKK